MLTTHAQPSSPRCLHCDAPTDTSSAVPGYCCRGCKIAHQIIVAGGLERFYDLAQGRVVAPPVVDDTLDTAWLEALIADPALPKGQLAFDLQGVHCAGCVWVIERIFSRQTGAGTIIVNPGRGTVRARIGPNFDAAAFVTALAQLGYRSGPLGKKRDTESDGLGMRLGVCAALALNSMTLSLSGYFGLAETQDPLLYGVFGWVNAALGGLAMMIGGPVFFKSAWAALRQRTLHLDLPISLGILLGGLGSFWLAVTQGHDAAFFDTLTIFVALMLLGRFLQRRVVARNRRFLLNDDGLAKARVRSIDPTTQALTWTRYDAIAPGDCLLVASGELIPVEVRAETPIDVSLAWFTGESEPVACDAGAPIPAGAHLVSQRAVQLVATASFEASSLAELLAPRAATLHRDGFWGAISTIYVAAVLLTAALGALAWSHAGADVALQVTIALLVVTCPCALGIATPLAYEIAHARLARRGLRVTTTELLDKVLRVEHVLFDKTGTLTLGDLSLDEPGLLETLSPDERGALYQMVARSNHPKSKALRTALEPLSIPYDPAVIVVEHAGVGLLLDTGGTAWRLDATQTAADAGADRQPLTLWCNDVQRATFAFSEQIRPDTRREISALQRLGVTPWLVSGDAPAHARKVADALRIDPQHVRSSQRPADKRALCETLGVSKILAIGDGINDAEMFDAAAVSGAVVTGSPTVAARADFFVASNAVAPASTLIKTALQVRRVVTRNLGFAVVYNALGITLAMMGLLTPLLCAVLMPMSALVVITLTVTALRDRRNIGQGRAALRPALAEVPS
ncbi:MAG: Cu2+-exporting ATPase [Myxococcota bacterium]